VIAVARRQRSVHTDLPGRKNGREVPFGSNSLQHGTAVFEGIRCYCPALGQAEPRLAAQGRAAFRLDAHITRLLESARLIGIDHAYCHGQIRARILKAARASAIANSYLRPVLFTPQQYLGVDLRSLTFELAVEVWPAPVAAQRYPAGIRVTISPWRRPARTSFPVRAKATGSYVVSAVARTCASAAGFDDAIQLDPESGRVAEATIANVFLVSGGRLRTPWLEDSLLAGITRDTVMVLAREMGIDTAEGPIEVADLLDADEVFLAGTASELIPVTAIDDRIYGPRRPVFAALAGTFRDIVSRRRPEHAEWLTPIESQS
jgi:branched-chain amino acid aminotransferase